MSKTFLITGGNFRNKGAQAMVFSVVQILRNNQPDCQVWMLYHSSDNKEQDVYSFNTMQWLICYKLRKVLGKLSFLVKLNRQKYIMEPRLHKYEHQVSQLYKKADAIFDVSGYNLSSQFILRASLVYLYRIAYAKKFNSRLFLLPQSFGPFNYRNHLQRYLISKLMKKYLKYPAKIFCREKQGYDDLKKYTSHNLSKALDIVLLSEKPKRRIIYKGENESKVKNTGCAKGIAIIPNSKILLWNTENDIWNLYREIIESIIKQGSTLYILRHSEEDLDFCAEIAALAKDYSNVNMLIDDYDCIDLFEIISQMDLVIASRYHSLVHAYKFGVPALVIGWADKYQELMAHFNQEKYYFDIRKNIDQSNLSGMLENLLDNKTLESELIKEKLVDYKKQSEDLFNVFK